jgi:misacylated tRNA(Ala) deacylase
MIPYERLLYSGEPPLTCAEVTVLQVDTELKRVALDRSAHYPGGGGQPPDHGVLRNEQHTYRIGDVKHDGELLWHELVDMNPLPTPGSAFTQEIDTQRRLMLSRIHSALHVVCGVVYRRCQAQTTGASMQPGAGRLDFAAPKLTGADSAQLEYEINQEIAAARPIRVQFVPRAQADGDPALIRAAPT